MHHTTCENAAMHSDQLTFKQFGLLEKRNNLNNKMTWIFQTNTHTYI